MEHLRPAIRREYEKWIKKIGEGEPYKGEHVLGIHEVLRAHFLIADFFSGQDDHIGLVGPRDIDLLHSALLRQFVSLGGTPKWKQKTELIATLFFGLIKDHPFNDGNKRTALLSALHHILKCNLTPSFRHVEFEKITMEVAENNLGKYRRYKDDKKRGKKDLEVLYLSNFFKRATREVDKRYYVITYNDLQTILNRHGYFLENPRGNHIDVVKHEIKRTIRSFPKGEKKSVMIAQIGFPSWKSQVNQGAIETVRKATGLTPEKGYDSQAFFRGVDDLQALIDIYSGPLTRLKDK